MRHWFADSGVFCLESGDLGLQAIEGLLGDQRVSGHFDGY
jgi:hypothetical protein